MRLRKGDMALLGLCLLLIACGGWFFFFTDRPIVPILFAKEHAYAALDSVLADRSAAIEQGADQKLFGHKDEINILTLGIDSRKEGNEQHCDAIHLVTFNIPKATISITSVPRGTFAMLPPNPTTPYKATDYYMSNACAFGGLDYGIDQITKVIGVKPDYVATVGFSSALGIFRLIDLPTTATLQWLRARQVYQIGDPQRSQNQATFMKDTALRLEKDGVPDPLFYLLYQLVGNGDGGHNSTIPKPSLALVKTLFAYYQSTGLADHPERITFAMKPFYATQELHLDATTADAQVTAIIEKLRGRLPEDDLSFKSATELQATLVDYLKTVIAQHDPDQITHVFNDALWEQVDDVATRQSLHIHILEAYIDLIKTDHHIDAVNLASDYILEMQYLQIPEYEEQGKVLLDELVK